MIYLMQGFVGSGKSTRAKEIESIGNTVRFTPDEWMTRLFGFDPPADRFADHLASILDLAQPLWIAVAENGGHVILDFGFWTRASRLEMSHLLRERNLPFTWIRMETPIEECRVRNRARHESGEGLLAIPDATFELLAKRYEPFGDEEMEQLSS